MGEDPGKWELSPPSPPPWELDGFSNPSLKDPGAIEGSCKGM